MSAAKKVEKSEIIKSAFKILRELGIEELNARRLAKALNCSTKPIYFQFKNMDDLKNEIKVLAERQYIEIFNECNGKYANDYIASGMAYLKFAKDEKYLFRYLYLRENIQSRPMYIDDANYDSIIKIICEKYKIDENKAKAFHYDMAIYSYGLAVMINSGFHIMTDNEIEERLSVQGKALYGYYVKEIENVKG